MPGRWLIPACQGPAIDKARDYIASHLNSAPDPYTLAVIANFATEYGRDRDFTRRSMQALLDARTEKEDQVFWSAEETGVYATGVSAAIETTGLATQALLKWGQASETARKALNFISQKKQASGAWGTTQATIMALRALLLSTQLGAADVHGSLQVMLDGREVKTLNLTASNNDLLHQFLFKGIDAQKPASVAPPFRRHWKPCLPGGGPFLCPLGREARRQSRFPSTSPTIAPGCRRTI